LKEDDMSRIIREDDIVVSDIKKALTERTLQVAHNRVQAVIEMLAPLRSAEDSSPTVTPEIIRALRVVRDALNDAMEPSAVDKEDAR
jgi:hypothetical protein